MIGTCSARKTIVYLEISQAHSGPWSLPEKTMTRSIAHSPNTGSYMYTGISLQQVKALGKNKVRMRILHEDGVEDGDVGDSGVCV